jgi:hypothetical protein
MNEHVIAKSIIILPAAFTQNSKTTSEKEKTTFVQGNIGGREMRVPGRLPEDGRGVSSAESL